MKQTKTYNEQLTSIASKKHMTASMTRIYVAFMEKRFPKDEYYTVDSYAEEWADRFKTNEPEFWMDSQSRLVYNEVTR